MADFGGHEVYVEAGRDYVFRVNREVIRRVFPLMVLAVIYCIIAIIKSSSHLNYSE